MRLVEFRGLFYNVEGLSWIKPDPFTGNLTLYFTGPPGELVLNEAETADFRAAFLEDGLLRLGQGQPLAAPAAEPGPGTKKKGKKPPVA